MSICGRLRAIGLVACLGLGAGAAAAETPAPAPPQAVPATPKEVPIAPKNAPSGTTPAQATPEQAPAAPKSAPSGTVPEAATPKEAPAVPKDAPKGTTPAPATPEAKPQAPTPSTPTPSTPAPGTPPGKELAPPGKPQTQEYEPNASPTTPRLATTETVQVPARPVVMVAGQASFDDAFKTIRAALDKANAALAKAGLTQTGHPLAIITETDEKGLKFEAALPIAAKPAGKSDLGDGVTIGESPAGTALKFRHQGPYDDIDRTYGTITSYLDNKGLEATSPFIEEYPDDLKSDDDPKLAVDIYIFIKK